MKYNLLINQVKSIEWELTTSEAILFSWIYELPSWAEKIDYQNKTYYYASRHLACKEVPIVSNKIDTIYRIYKKLQEKNLINLLFIEKKDYISLTKKGQEWYKDKVTEQNPQYGKFSETEKNPTYNNINISGNTIDLIDKETKDIYKAKFDFLKALIEIGVEESIAKDWLLVRKNKKASNTKTAFTRIKNELEKSNGTPTECITFAVVRSWAGYEADWYNKEHPQQELFFNNGNNNNKNVWQL